MQFRVTVAGRESGSEQQLLINCATAEEARAKADVAGYLVSEVVPIGDPMAAKVVPKKKMVWGILLGTIGLLVFSTGAWFAIKFAGKATSPAPPLAAVASSSAAGLDAAVTTSTRNSISSSKPALTLDEVNDFGREFGRRLSEKLSDKDTSVTALGTKTDIRQTNSLVHPVVAAITLEMLSTKTRQTGNYSYSRIIRSQYELTFAHDDAGWDLVEGSSEVLSDVQVPDDATPTKKGQKSSVTSDPYIALVLLQMKREQADEAKAR